MPGAEAGGTHLSRRGVLTYGIGTTVKRPPLVCKDPSLPPLEGRRTPRRASKGDKVRWIPANGQVKLFDLAQEDSTDGEPDSESRTILHIHSHHHLVLLTLP